MLARVHVALLPQLLPTAWLSVPSWAVVIDTLRFTTTACQALAAGARSVTVAADIDAAHQMSRAHSPPLLLCGERLCRPIPGFHFGNSPYEYTSHVSQGKHLVFTTTNGTLAVAAARVAERIVLAGLVNRSAVAEALLSARTAEARIVCAGTDGEVATEDVLTAGAIIDALQQRSPSIQLANDSAWLALAASRNIARLPAAQQPAAITGIFQQASGGSNLIDNGYERDLQFAAQVDSLTLVPQSTPEAFHTFTPADVD